MIRLFNSMRFSFGIKQKGPTSYRALKQEGSSLNSDDQKVEDFFQKYSQTAHPFYRSGFKSEDLTKANNMVKQVFSLDNGTASEVLAFKKQKAVQKYQKHMFDHGTPAVQFACMTQKVILMMNHCKKYPKDTTAARSLTRLIEKRRNMMDYCMRKDYHRFKWICMDYGIPAVHRKDANHKGTYYKFNSSSGY